MLLARSMDSTTPSYIIRRKPVRASTDIPNTSEAGAAPTATANARPRAQTQPTQGSIAPIIPRKPLNPTAGNATENGRPKARSTSTPHTSQLHPQSQQHPQALTPQIGTHLSRRYSTKRLTKPPKLHPRKHSHRKKLQKRVKRKSSDRVAPLSVFVLQYEKYPYYTEPGLILGAYSSIGTVTNAAIEHGAYAFSKEGMRDGTEYLSPSGRIKILKRTIQRVGPRAPMPKGRHPEFHKERPDSTPKPSGAGEEPKAPVAIDGKEGVLVAVHRSPTGIFCIGAFTERKRAWGACLKHRFTPPFSEFAEENDGWVDEYQMPHVRAREIGAGWHEWFVVPYKIDEAVGRR